MKHGLCQACYLRRRRGTLTSKPCECCSYGHPATLRLHKLADGQHSLCGNCATIAGRRSITLAGLRALVFPDGDRRRSERRQGMRRAPTERRDAISGLLHDGPEHRAAGRRAADAAGAGFA